MDTRTVARLLLLVGAVAAISASFHLTGWQTFAVAFGLYVAMPYRQWEN